MNCKKDDYSRRMISQFFRPLMSVDLPLMKNVLTLLAKCTHTKSVFNTITINNCSISNRWNYSKENLWISQDCTDNLKQRNGWYHENKKSILLIKDINETIKNQAKITKGRITWDCIRYISCQCFKKYVRRQT